MTAQREIIGFMFGTKICCGLEVIERIYGGEIPDRIVYRDEIEFMTKFDLGIVWEKIFKMPTLIYEDERGNYSWERK